MKSVVVKEIGGFRSPLGKVKISLGIECLGFNWFDSIVRLSQRKQFMLTPRQFFEFLVLVKKGLVFDEDDKQLSSSECEEIFLELVGPKNRWRCEWLDLSFQLIGGERLVTFGHVLHGNEIVSQKQEIVQTHLALKGAFFDLDSIGEHGLPTVQGSTIQFWCPDWDGNCVAEFGVDLKRANLNCDGSPFFRHDSLGVRPAQFC